MRINELTVGPIVGETTPHRVRIWGRGDTTLIDGEPRRCFGALRYRTPKGDWSKPVTCKMNPNFDMSGVAIVAGLDAETRYEYHFGYFFSGVEPKDATRFTGASMPVHELQGFYPSIRVSLRRVQSGTVHKKR